MMKVADLNSIQGIIGIEEYLIKYLCKRVGVHANCLFDFKDQLHVLSK